MLLISSMQTPQWTKKLGGHAGELYVAAELSKRAIPNSLLPENFSHHDIIIGSDEANGYIQVKSCHPDRAVAFRLDNIKHVDWVKARENEFVVFVWLGSVLKNESPVYWVARMKEVGYLWKQSVDRYPQSQRLAPDEDSGLVRKWNAMRLYKNWRNDWNVFKSYVYFR